MALTSIWGVEEYLYDTVYCWILQCVFNDFLDPTSPLLHSVWNIDILGTWYFLQLLSNCSQTESSLTLTTKWIVFMIFNDTHRATDRVHIEWIS